MFTSAVQAVRSVEYRGTNIPFADPVTIAVRRMMTAVLYFDLKSIEIKSGAVSPLYAIMTPHSSDKGVGSSCNVCFVRSRFGIAALVYLRICEITTIR